MGTNATTEYTVTQRGREPLVVRAASHQAAAHIAARRLYGHRGRVSAIRTTGHPNLSGQFRAYLPAAGGGQTSTGEPFHVC